MIYVLFLLSFSKDPNFSKRPWLTSFNYRKLNWLRLHLQCSELSLWGHTSHQPIMVPRQNYSSKTQTPLRTLAEGPQKATEPSLHYTVGFYPTSLSFSFTQSQTNSVVLKLSQTCPTPSPFSPTQGSSNNILAHLIPLWHLLFNGARPEMHKYANIYKLK